MSQAISSIATAQGGPSGAHSGGVYLDYNATTPVDPVVVERMNEFFTTRFGNAASPNRRGGAAEASVERAASQVGQLVKRSPSQVVWTSGATESLNTVIKGLSFDPPNGRRTIVSSAAEHKAVLDSLAWVSEALGIQVRLAAPNNAGAADAEALADLVDEETFLVVAMAANNETGAISDIARIAELSHEAGARYLCDLTQLAGKVDIDLSDGSVDYAVLSAHKMYGPQGVGALVANRTARRHLVPLVHGGGHQGGARSGTLNLPGIAGFGEAAEIATERLSAGEPEKLRAIRDSLEGMIQARIENVVVHSNSHPRLPNTSSVRFVGVDGEALVASMGQVALATGSACTSAVPAPSHVLTSMGISDVAANETIRISTGRFTSKSEIEFAVERLVAEVARIRGLSA